MKALPFSKVVLEEFESTSIIKPSGKHTRKSDAADESKIVEELMKSNAFIPRANRKYSVYSRISNLAYSLDSTITVYMTGLINIKMISKRKEKHASDALKKL